MNNYKECEFKLLICIIRNPYFYYALVIAMHLSFFPVTRIIFIQFLIHKIPTIVGKKLLCIPKIDNKVLPIIKVCTRTIFSLYCIIEYTMWHEWKHACFPERMKCCRSWTRAAPVPRPRSRTSRDVSGHANSTRQYAPRVPQQKNAVIKRRTCRQNLSHH